MKGVGFHIEPSDDKDFEYQVKDLIDAIDDIVERLRSNEGVDSKVVRKDTADGVDIDVFLSDHDAIDAMLEKIESVVFHNAKNVDLE